MFIFGSLREAIVPSPQPMMTVSFFGARAAEIIPRLKRSFSSLLARTLKPEREKHNPNLFLRGTSQFKESSLEIDLEQVTRRRSAVHELVRRINRDAVDDALNLASLAVRRANLSLGRRHFPDAER